jgi:hypothetical protein
VAGVVTLVLALALTAGCGSGSVNDGGSDAGAASTSATASSDASAGADSGGSGGGGSDGGSGGGDPAEPVDVEAALAGFEAPPEDSGVPGPKPEECPGADAAPMLAAFPDARPFQATSLVQNPPDAADDEVHLQCRMSYEVELFDGDECSIMEVRDVVFGPEAPGAPGGNDGTVTTTTVMTYFTGGARKDGVVLDYTLSAGCAEASDLSELEVQFRSVWVAHRDRFLASPAYEQP